MQTVRDLLRSKGTSVWGISPDTTTIEALRSMAEKNVGALVVIEDEQLRGIISERDFVRRIAREGLLQLDLPVRETMTAKVITVRTAQTIHECMELMTQNHIRHLPVVENDRLVGLISIGDVVKALITEQDGLIQDLQHYIGGERL